MDDVPLPEMVTGVVAALVKFRLLIEKTPSRVVLISLAVLETTETSVVAPGRRATAVRPSVEVAQLATLFQVAVLVPFQKAAAGADGGAPASCHSVSPTPSPWVTENTSSRIRE